MKQIKHVYKHWLPKILNAWAVTIGYTIYYDIEEEKVTTKLRNHELKHIEQIRTLGIFFFYVDYFRQYVINRLNGLNHADAAWEITYEVEAREASMKEGI